MHTLSDAGCTLRCSWVSTPVLLGAHSRCSRVYLPGDAVRCGKFITPVKSLKPTREHLADCLHPIIFPRGFRKKGSP